MKWQFDRRARFPCPDRRSARDCAPRDQAAARHASVLRPVHSS